MERTLFGTRLVALRKAHHLTQEKVAKMLDIDRSTYTCYEIGNSMPGVMTLCTLADIFNVSMDYLMGRTDTPKLANVTQPQATAEELQLMEYFRHLNERQRLAVVSLLKTL
ncbi:MAG: helix-turn-helix transcriptional regulator [Clostridia bacterium]|nr:helix-turn-helix transcriptional regulator [Clostridia bacterium]